VEALERAFAEQAEAEDAPVTEMFFEPLVIVVHGPEAVRAIPQSIFGDVPQLVREGDKMTWTDATEES
jgi:hypothetical protein